MASYTVSKQLGVVVVFTLILLHCGSCKSISCDVNHCKSLFSTVFKDFFKKGTRILCRSSDDTIDSIDKCLQTFFPDKNFVKSETSIASVVCSYEFEYDLNKHWDCISSHFHGLLTCMSKFGTMMATSTSSRTLKLLSCRKYLETLNCPYEVLYDCEEKAIEIVTKLFSKVLKAPMDFACSAIPTNDAYDLNVTYSLNNSYSSTSACLDKLPDVAGNCFTQYLKTFDTDEIYHCRETCTNQDEEACQPFSLMNDFYIPVVLFCKHSCEEDSAAEHKVQMQEQSEASTISYSSDIPSVVNSKNSITSPVDEKDDFVPSDEAKTGDVLSLDSNGVEASTLNYKLNTEQMKHDNALSAILASNNSPPHTSVARPKINSPSSGYAADNATGNNGACRHKYYFQYLFSSLIAILIFL